MVSVIHVCKSDRALGEVQGYTGQGRCSLRFQAGGTTNLRAPALSFPALSSGSHARSSFGLSAAAGEAADVESLPVREHVMSMEMHVTVRWTASSRGGSITDRRHVNSTLRSGVLVFRH
jgi:hypothetical protein